ncbi:alpha/beta hydrolase, partial [Pseudovibrio sp. WM33]|uniref:alpha/beta hydrolase n=3 Tax=Pseudovibrio TaxID=258255 RepID=UPI00187D4B79
GGGRFGDVALVEDDKFTFEANIVQLPEGNDVIFDGYTSKELFDQFHTFFTSPDAGELAKQWIETKLSSHCEKHEITTGGQPFYRSNLDLFVPKDQKALRPLLIHIHGGYWQYTQKDIYYQIANSFTQEDVLVANLNYPQVPDVSIQEMIEVVKKSIRYLYVNAEKWGIDRDRISVAGHSSGAHLTACMGVFNWSQLDPDLPGSIFKNVVAFSGGYNMEPYMHDAQNYQMGISPEDLPFMSPLHLPCHRGAKFTLYAGSKESAEYQAQTKDFYDHLVHNRVEADLRIIEQGDHFSVINEFYTHGGPIFNHVLSIL